MSRIPLPTSLKTRTSAPDKDARMTNCYAEIKGNDAVMRKRAGISLVSSMTAGVAQGGIEVVPDVPAVMISDTFTFVITVGDGTVVADAAAVSDAGGGTLADNTAAAAEAGALTPDSAKIAASGFNMSILFPTCESITVPADNDRGTTQFAGPSETPYSVPQPTVVDTLILETNCWDLYRRSTKTYSQRSVNTTYYKRSLNGVSVTGQVPGTPGVSASAHDIFSTISAADAKIQGDLYCASTYSALLPSTIGSYVRSLGNDGYISGGTTNLYYVYFLSPSTYKGAYVTAGTTSTITANLYYLDVQETWSYYII